MRSPTTQLVESHRCFGGEQRVFTHESAVLGCTMRVAAFLPPGHEGRKLPVLVFLSGLTCSEQNVITKAGAQRACADHGVILICPDTSPRGPDVADDDAWDLGQGAGFYLSATQEPWAPHFAMDRYVLDELPALAKLFTDNPAQSITGHSMGGHGALVLALRSPGTFRSVSAFSPILNPSMVPWGRKAFTAYLGDDESTWAEWDATRLLQQAPKGFTALIDQGGADGFLANQLDASGFLAAALDGGHPVTYRLQGGHDHSYYFVASFIDDHVAHHAAALKRG